MYIKNNYKIDIILIVILIIISLLLIDFLDINEKIRFPISVLDEPLMVVFGAMLGYLVAKFRFLRLMKKELDKKGF